MNKYLLATFLFIIAVLSCFCLLLSPDNIVFTGGRTMVQLWNPSDLDVKVSTGTFTDASTTVISVANPHSATSVLDMFIYEQTGVATSTYSLTCGTSTTITGSPSATIVNAISVPTSTTLHGVFGMNSGVTYSPLLIKGGERINCLVTTDYSEAFTNTANTYAGSYVIRFLKK